MPSTRLRLTVLYRPPGISGSAILDFEQLALYLRSVALHNITHVIVGDFNCPDIDWQLMSAPSGSLQEDFLFCLSELGLTQLVHSPTHSAGNTLDLILVNDPFVVFGLELCCPFSTSDHASLEFSIMTPSEPNKVVDSANHCIPVRSAFPDWKRADFVGLAADLADIDWESLHYTALTPNELWEAYLNIFNTAVSRHVPMRRIQNDKKVLHKRYPRHIKRLFLRKACLWRRTVDYPQNVGLALNYKRLAAQCKLAVRDHQIHVESRIIDSGKVGDFYKYANGKLSSRTGVGPLKKADGSFALMDGEKSELLNTFFASVCIQDDDTRPHIPSVSTPSGLDSITVLPFQVASKLRALKVNSSAGPDCLPPIFFKTLERQLARPLSLFFNSLLSVGAIPDQWRLVNVTPVHKKGDASVLNNYRPISLTPVCCKILESLIKDKVMAYLLAHNMLSPSQHGFLKRHSTLTNLLETVDDWTIALNNRESVAVAYVDFAKAFDSVVHSKLIIKLQSFGLGGLLLQWIANFLKGRQQKTVVGRSCSRYTDMGSGVPQGSVLGPLLFVMYINDLPSAFHHSVTSKLYADDLKLYTVLSKLSDSQSLQRALVDLERWACTWQLPISLAKCVSFSVGRISIANPLALGGVFLPVSDSVSDLGVLVDNDLKFDSHIRLIAQKGHAKANLIRRTFMTKDYNYLIKAFTTYVRPALEYASPVWSPSYVGLIALIESVQRKFTKRLSGLWDFSYAERLNRLGLHTLEYRRLMLDLQLCYKITHGLACPGLLALFTVRTGPTRGHKYKLLVPSAWVNPRSHFFASRVVGVWNSLPSTVVDAPSLSSFKLRLRPVDFSNFLCTLTD